MFFGNCKTLDELKKEYRRLSKIHHPDLGGDVETMKRVNAEYEAAFARIKNTSEVKQDRETRETPDEFVRIINKLIKLDGLRVELCGRWLWISGDTKRHKDALKAAGCRWASKKSMWYWHPADETTTGHRKTYSIEHIREKYGSVSFAAASADAAVVTC